MKMNISSKETHERVHFYHFSQKELEKLALEKVASELGLKLESFFISSESTIVSRDNGINPRTYECRIRIVETLDCKE